jgi:hypothetical protein
MAHFLSSTKSTQHTSSEQEAAFFELRRVYVQTAVRSHPSTGFDNSTVNSGSLRSRLSIS